MISVASSIAVSRSTLQTLRQDFHQAAELFPSVRHAILQALDKEGTIPPSLEREMRQAGGWSDGEFRGRRELIAAATTSSHLESSDLELLKLDCAAKRSYLFGERAGRERFEYLAKRAWLALPGTADGKAKAYPQPRALERWLAFVYQELKYAGTSYLPADEELWVCDYRKGRHIERRFLPRDVKGDDAKSDDVITADYPDAVGLSQRARRWIYTALATDPFTASTVAIDMRLALSDAEIPYLVSFKEADLSTYPKTSNYLVEYINLGEGRQFRINRDSCKPVPGSTPSVCPNADPPTDQADRNALLAYLPAIEERFRELNLIKVGETIHWVGRGTRLGTVCRCNLNFAGTIAVSEAKPPTTSEQSFHSTEFPPVDDEDIAILRALERNKLLMTVGQIAGHSRVGEKTVGSRVNELIEKKLAIRPMGEKRGTIITPKGMELLKTIPAEK